MDGWMSTRVEICQLHKITLHMHTKTVHVSVWLKSHQSLCRVKDIDGTWDERFLKYIFSCQEDSSASLSSAICQDTLCFFTCSFWKELSWVKGFSLQMLLWKQTPEARLTLETWVALVLMDDSSAAWCQCLQDHFPSAPQAGAVWTGDQAWSQWLNELLCMMESLAGCTRGLEVLDVGLAYHEEKVYCSAERVRSWWCFWLICFSIDMFYCYTVFR